MNALTAERLAGNAYRRLGISAASGQAAIDSAARRMRLWPDPKRIPPTAWDAPWLGPIARSRADIEQALATLNDPRSRVEERLLWYAGRVPGSAPKDDGGDVTSASPETLHDELLTLLHRAHLCDSGGDPLPLWQRVAERATTLAGDSQWSAWLARLEEEGDFEKRASSEEVAAAARAFVGAIAGALVPRAEAALDAGDMERALGILALLRSAQSPGESSSLVNRLLERLEDDLDVRCRRLDQSLREKLRTNRLNPDEFFAHNIGPTRGAALIYKDEIDPALKRFAELASGGAEAQADRILRVRSRCGQVLSLIGLGWEWSGRYVQAETTYLAALELARGSPLEMTLHDDLERVKPMADQERWVESNQEVYSSAGVATWNNAGLSGLSEQSIELTGPATRTRQTTGSSSSDRQTGGGFASSPEYNPKPAKQSSGWQVSGWVIFFVVIGRLLISLADSSKNSSSRPRPSNDSVRQWSDYNLTPRGAIPPPDPFDEVMEHLSRNPSTWMPGPTTAPSASQTYGEVNREQ